jgi:hypothetical protein
VLLAPAYGGAADVTIPAAARFTTTQKAVPRYFRRVLFLFRWGSEGGRLGMMREGEPVSEVPVPGAPLPPARPSRTRDLPPAGPDKMVVDGRGNVFIHDPVNRRTVIWDRKDRAVRLFPAAFPFSRAVCFDGHSVWALADTGDVVGRIEKTPLATGVREVIEFDQSAGTFFYDGLNVLPGGIITLESPRNGKLASVDLYAARVRITAGEQERVVFPLEVESLRREGEEEDAPEMPPWTVDDPHLSLYQGGMTIVSGDQVKVDARGRVYLRLVKARENVFHREFLQCYSPRGGFLWEAPLDRSELLYPDIEKGALVDVDRAGDVYQLVVREQGAELVQWDWGWGGK